MPRLTILPVTLTAAAVLFVIIISRRSPDLPTRLASAAIGAIAAPMIFELPFDPIVIFRIHMVLPDPPPWTLVYVPLLLVQITTLLLVRLSPMVRLNTQLAIQGGLDERGIIWGIGAGEHGRQETQGTARSVRNRRRCWGGAGAATGPSGSRRPCCSC